MLRPVYIYRGTLTDGGCSKIIKDLILLLSKENKYHIHLVTITNTNYDINMSESGDMHHITSISIPKDPWWMKKSVSALRNRISDQKDPVLISFLDYNSNDFISICSAFLDNKVRWINFNTNHPKIISNWFSRKNSGVGISEEDFFKSVDCIRLENKNFKKYMPVSCQDKCVDFLNTVSIPKAKGLKFKHKLNLISVNGLRERRKSILPFVEKFDVMISANLDFKLHVVGEIGPPVKKELDNLLSKNPSFSSYIDILPVVKNIHDYYKSCDLMVTTASFEGTSNAVLESFSHNIPVLCLKKALGLNETVEHGVNGFLCLDPHDMASRVLALNDNKNELKKLKDNCDEIKPYITDPKLGIEKYLDLIDSKDFNHDSYFRNKLSAYSKSFLSSPFVYREKLEGLIIYVDVDKVNLNNIREALNSKAREESRKTFFICRYSGGEGLKSFLEFLKDYNDCEILYKYTKTPSHISKYISTQDGAEGLVCLSYIESIKNRLIDSGYDVICYYDSDCNDPSFLNHFEYNLKQLSLWKSKDAWIWMIGSSPRTMNSCLLNYEPWSRYDFNNFINMCKSHKDHYISSCGRVSSKISLPQELMKKIRRLY
jgi:hypothetical protein